MTSNVVLKVGGNVLQDPGAVKALCGEVAALRAAGHHVVVVHGGGPQLDAAITRLGEPVEKVDGLRVTSTRGADVVREVLDKIGDDVHAALLANGMPAVRMPATTKHFASHQKDPRLGRVATVDRFTAAGKLAYGVPVVTPVGWDALGPLNLNADEGASAVAAAMKAKWLVLATDVAAVRDGSGQSLGRITPDVARRLIAEGAASGGMIPKLRSALEALEAGVPRILITQVAPGTLASAVLDGKEVGTLLEVPMDAGLAETWNKSMAPNYPTPSLQLAKGRGAHVWDSSGKRYLDLLAGIAVNVLGHAHPAVVAAVSHQVATLGHTTNLYAHEPGLRLARRLQSYAGGHKVIFQNSGTEAIECALKLARRHAHAQGMPEAVAVAFKNGFHGRSMGALSLTWNPAYREKFDPLPGQVVHIPFNDPAALEEVFSKHKVAAVFFEAIQGEGGLTPLSSELAKTMARLCEANNALLVADEIQAGVGRTGRFFGYEHFGLKPQVITLAKGVGGGLPLGATLIEPEAAKLFGPGSHGTTFGGNPVACAAGNAVLDVLEKDKLTARAGRMGDSFAKALRDGGRDAGVSVRGLGLLMGLPLNRPDAGKVVEELRGAGYLAGQAGKGVVRMAPPLIVEEADLMEAVPHIVKAVTPHLAVPAKAAA